MAASSPLRRGAKPHSLVGAGSMLTGGTFWFVTGLFILFALTVVIFMAKKIWLERQKRNA
ncbi:hypothetical protein BMR86_25560 [Stenotrophomonas sp. KAs 5-3]|nr:hypothetical protein BMR86_25560 [Stenotrophomonas sp. KAs 5-3]